MKYIKTYEHTLQKPDNYPTKGDYIMLSNEQGYYLLYIINSKMNSTYENSSVVTSFDIIDNVDISILYNYVTQEYYMPKNRIFTFHCKCETLEEAKQKLELIKYNL